MAEDLACAIMDMASEKAEKDHTDSGLQLLVQLPGDDGPRLWKKSLLVRLVKGSKKAVLVRQIGNNDIKGGILQIDPNNLTFVRFCSREAAVLFTTLKVKDMTRGRYASGVASVVLCCKSASEDTLTMIRTNGWNKGILCTIRASFDEATGPEKGDMTLDAALWTMFRLMDDTMAARASGCVEV